MINIKELERTIKAYQEDLENVRCGVDELKKMTRPGCTLYSMKHRNGFQYFIRSKGAGTHGKYIKKDSMEIAERLAQIEYYGYLADSLEKTIKNLDQIRRALSKDPFTHAEEKMSAGKRALISRPYIDDGEYIKEWLKQNYEIKGFRENEKEFYTRADLRVRSKTEVIIADMLDEEGIPFLYEKPLRLGAGTVHPDFTLLNIKERKEVYWEHFGMMDDMEYRNNAFIKIREYEDSCLYQYDSLILTFETSRYPVNTKMLRGMIRKLKELLGY